MKNIILNYIKKITINNINDFAIKHNIILNNNELIILHNILKNNYEDILTGNDEKIMKYLQVNIHRNSYDKIISLYKSYKEKYKNYL